MKSKEFHQCRDCWWYDCCSGTVKACHIFAQIDMRWKESPNNRRRENEDC